MRRALGLTWGALSRAPALALARACRRYGAPGVRAPWHPGAAAVKGGAGVSVR